MVLGLADRLTPAYVLVLAALGGIVRPNDQLMRNTLIGDTIPRDQLMGAVGMSRMTMDSARVAGVLPAPASPPPSAWGRRTCSSRRCTWRAWR